MINNAQNSTMNCDDILIYHHEKMMYVGNIMMSIMILGTLWWALWFLVYIDIGDLFLFLISYWMWK